MRILYVTDQVYLHGGAEKILIQKLNYWADVLGHETMLVTTHQKGLKPFVPLSDKVRMTDLAIGYTGGTFYSKANLQLLPEHFRALKKAIADWPLSVTTLMRLSTCTVQTIRIDQKSAAAASRSVRRRM